MWPEVIAANVQSYEVSVKWQEESGRPLHMRDFHTFSWLLDAYISLGQFENAGEVKLNAVVQDGAMEHNHSKMEHHKN